jgi:hypothetical protein
VEVNHLRPIFIRDLPGIIGTLRIDDIDFAEFGERLQTARQIPGFVPGCDDHAHWNTNITLMRWRWTSLHGCLGD